MKNIAVLGSTGSIGTQTLDVVRANPERLCVKALAAGHNITQLESQIREFHPQIAAVWDEEKAKELRIRTADLPVKIVSGMEGLLEIAQMEEAEVLVTAIVGMIGIRPTIAAIKAGKDIALANKETLVTAGHIIMPLAKEYNVPAQSHLSENPGEIAWVAELCPGTKFYGESYSRYGLFGGGVPTVMAHCIYSPDDEAALMKQNRVMIAHCPTSNENVIAGIAPAAHYLRGGWRVGLGSDVAGGQTLDLFTVMATAVQVSKLRWRYIDQSEKPLTMVEALYMATVGGGDFWADFGEKVGLFEDGYAFDALVLDDDPLKNMRAFSAAERLERYA